MKSISFDLKKIVMNKQQKNTNRIQDKKKQFDKEFTQWGTIKKIKKS